MVVVSAMAGETNRLIALAKDVQMHPNPRELDVMVWKKPASLPTPPDVRVHAVSGRADREAAVEIVLRGFDFPIAWKDVLMSSLGEEADQVAGQTFLADVGGKPAGVAALVRTGEKISGIYSVATLPEFRRRGVATALSLRCIDAYQDSDDEVLALQVLHGSEAQRLYEKLGFETAYALTLHSLP